MNVLITRAAATNVKVNGRFFEQRQFERNVWTVECNSKGAFEQWVIDAVAH
jgi:hypothetical protein